MSNSIILETCWLLTAVDAFSHQLRPLVALQLTRARRLIYPLTGYKLHGSSRPISMKSDVIRKRAHHDARRVCGFAVCLFAFAPSLSAAMPAPPSYFEFFAPLSQLARADRPAGRPSVAMRTHLSVPHLDPN